MNNKALNNNENEALLGYVNDGYAQHLNKQ